MKWVVNIIAIILLLVGIIWILQGVSILPGSFMTGNIMWAIIGLILDLVGAGMLYLTNRRRSA